MRTSFITYRMILFNIGNDKNQINIFYIEMIERFNLKEDIFGNKIF